MNLKFCVVLVLVVFIINCMMGPNVLAQKKLLSLKMYMKIFGRKVQLTIGRIIGIIKGMEKTLIQIIILLRQKWWQF